MAIAKSQESDSEVVSQINMPPDGEKGQATPPASDGEPAQEVAAELVMDQGVVAWLQVLGSWILFANTW